MTIEQVIVEANLNGTWVDLNDQVNFRFAGDVGLTSTSTAKKKITATSPVLDGEYIIHATGGMVTEQIKFWVYGNSLADLHTNVLLLDRIFDQYDFRIRFTMDNYREYWYCQMADTTLERSNVYMHSTMCAFSAQVPRFPDVLREEVI